MATFTITTTVAQDAKIVEAFGAHLNLGRNATAAEVKQALSLWLTDIVHSYEQAKAANQAKAGIPRITPT